MSGGTHSGSDTQSPLHQHLSKSLRVATCAGFCGVTVVAGNNHVAFSDACQHRIDARIDLYRKFRFDPVKDFVPITQAAIILRIIDALPSLPAGTPQTIVNRWAHAWLAVSIRNGCAFRLTNAMHVTI